MKSRPWLRSIRKHDREISRRIASVLQGLLTDCDDPRQRGKPLRANLAKLWRYWVGDHRVICQIEDARLLVLVVRIAHPSAAYD